MGRRVVEETMLVREAREVIVDAMRVDLGGTIQTLSAGTLGYCRGQAHKKAEENDAIHHAN